jgi:hypothetical protein
MRRRVHHAARRRRRQWRVRSSQPYPWVHERAHGKDSAKFELVISLKTARARF